MSRVAIKSLTLIETRPSERKALVLAQFSASFSGLDVPGCRLILSDAGRVFACGPLTQGRPGDVVRFTDQSLREEVGAAALAIYTAMGGTVPAIDAVPVHGDA
jgi:hypothetical protein